MPLATTFFSVSLGAACASAGAPARKAPAIVSASWGGLRLDPRTAARRGKTYQFLDHGNHGRQPRCITRGHSSYVPGAATPRYRTLPPDRARRGQICAGGSAGSTGKMRSEARCCTPSLMKRRASPARCRPRADRHCDGAQARLRHARANRSARGAREPSEPGCRLKPMAAGFSCDRPDIRLSPVEANGVFGNRGRSVRMMSRGRCVGNLARHR